MQKAYKGKKISDARKIEILNLSENDITMEKLQELFAYTKNEDAKFDPSDYFELESNIHFNKDKITTTVGRYIFNLLIIDAKLGRYIGYINHPMDGGAISKLDKQLSTLLLEDKITVADFSNYIDKMQWLGFGITKFIATSLSTTLMMTPPQVKSRKEELIVKHKKAIDSGDIVTVSKIEKELLTLSHDILKDASDMDIYDSGSRGSFNNNFKQTAVARGVTKSYADPNDVRVSMASLDDGIPPDELYQYAEIITSASASRAIGTQDGGYEAKKLATAFQSIILGDHGSDCKSKKYLNITLTNNNINLFITRYVKDGDKLTQITEENKGKFINKNVEMRSPLYCKSEHICNKCAGELYYQMGIKNVGLIANGIGNALTGLSMV
ncbi:hypothetical protein FPHOBKDP_00077 [Listeria phage LPJP1]|nr:hypothetical protein FPHOBKDP_00077 [Listeria phage LPJP1]